MSNPAEDLLKVYGAATVAKFALHHGLPGQDPFVELTEFFANRATRQKIVDSLPADVRGFLGFLDEIGRRLRGERLKKRWFLHGYEEFERLIEPLLEKGIVLAGNLGSREALSLETVYEQGLMQQWVQVTPGFEGLAGEPPAPREVVEKVADPTESTLLRRTLTVELNLLSLTRFVERNAIRLNRDGSPHRTDLKALAPLVVERTRMNERGEYVVDPLQIDGWDVVTFLLSTAVALGLIERRDDLLRTTPACNDYFIKPALDRWPLLQRAVEQQKTWSEFDAQLWFQAGEPPLTGQGHGGFLNEGGRAAGLAGPRGSIVAALRRLNLEDWFDVEETTRTIASLEQTYLRTVLPVAPMDDRVVEGFVHSVITQLLPHIGAIELGKSATSGVPRARITDVGRLMSGVPSPADEPSGKGAILVEPTFEITCFLDLASLALLYDLSRFAEVVKTSERVVRYRLTGESVQWGYAKGYTAESIFASLTRYSSQSVPPSVRFALQDWERLHRRVTVFLHGDIIAATGKADPEVVQSGVTFAIDNRDHVDRIDAVHTFVLAGNHDPIERALTAHKPRVIDYNGPIVPSLLWADGDRLRAPTGATDLRIISKLQALCVSEEDETYRIDPARVDAVFGAEEGYARLIDFLRGAMANGLTAERELHLKKSLGHPAQARVETMEVLMLGSAEDGDRVARIADLEPFIAARLGPNAFRVVPGTTSKLLTALKKHAVAVPSR
jgi:hypothetical protein